LREKEVEVLACSFRKEEVEVLACSLREKEVEVLACSLREKEISTSERESKSQTNRDNMVQPSALGAEREREREREVGDKYDRDVPRHILALVC
jgi:hypothetical protein